MKLQSVNLAPYSKHNMQIKSLWFSNAQIPLIQDLDLRPQYVLCQPSDPIYSKSVVEARAKANV